MTNQKVFTRISHATLSALASSTKRQGSLRMSGLDTGRLNSAQSANWLHHTPKRRFVATTSTMALTIPEKGGRSLGRPPPHFSYCDCNKTHARASSEYERTASPHSAQLRIEHSEGMLGIDGVASSPCAVRVLLETLSKLEHLYVQRIAYQVLTPTRLDSLPL